MALVSKNFSDIITFTRASTATFFDSAGVLQSAAINAPRLDYDPSTLAAQGLLIEESRTNSIRNNTMVGAVAGTPGTLPTNWSVSGITGITREIVGTGVSNGITYIDVRYSGTTPVGGGLNNINLDASTAAAAANGQSWTSSSYFALVGGTTTGVNSIRLRVAIYSSVPAYLGELVATPTNLVSSLTSPQRRLEPTSGTISNASAAFVQPYIEISFAASTAVDFTLRIGLPQLELGAFATSVIPTTTTALTRAADVASVNTLSPWYNSASGTLYAEAQTFSTSGTAVLAGIDDTTTANRIQLRRSFAFSASGYRMVSSGGSIDIAQVSGTVAGVNKLSIAATAGAQTASTNGSTVTGIVSITPMPTVTRLALGDGPGSTPLNGWLRRVTFYPRVLSQSEQNAITA